MSAIWLPSDILVHHGIKGQKWGVRRYQNKDGSLTSQGKKRYQKGYLEEYKPKEKTLNKTYFEKEVMTSKTKDGKQMTLEQVSPSLIAKGLARVSDKILMQQLNDKNFDIKIDGNKIGDLELTQDSPTEVNGVWLGINEDHRGNGYATTALMMALNKCKNEGYKTFTLEVPGNSPDARHIYEKLGFVATDKLTEDDVWGGLTAMKLDLTKYDW